jgi:hypothetical protein
MSRIASEIAALGIVKTIIRPADYRVKFETICRNLRQWSRCRLQSSQRVGCCECRPFAGNKKQSFQAKRAWAVPVPRRKALTRRTRALRHGFQAGRDVVRVFSKCHQKRECWERRRRLMCLGSNLWESEYATRGRDFDAKRCTRGQRQL